MNSELSPLIEWIALWKMNLNSEFQVYIFTKNRDITKCQFSHNNDDANAIVIPQVFSEKADLTIYL